MANRLIPPLLLFLILLGAAHAQQPSGTFSVEVIPLTNMIAVNETALFNISISNGYPEEREFQVEKTGYPFWDMYTNPLATPITTQVPPNGQKSILLYVKPQHITVVDTYTLETFVIELASERKQTIPLTIGIKSTDALIKGYVPTVLTTISLPDIIDPREPLSISLNLNNQNMLDYPNLTVRLSSKLITGEFFYQLDPQEEKRVEIVKQLDPNTPPQKDRLVISLLREGKTITNPITKDYSVLEYVVKNEQPTRGSFLKKEKKIQFSSNNPQYEGLLREPTSRFGTLFTTTRPKATVAKDESGTYLLWTITLDSKRQMDVTITQNYRPLAIIIVVLLILAALYFLFRSPIVLLKEIASVSMKEGGISEVKVILRVKNRGREPLDNIEVGDIIPTIATVEKEVSLGVMHPEKMTSLPHKGTVIKWIVPHLDQNEGVVLSYKMKSRLTIVGDFNLPSATARCKHRNSYVITNSNRATVHN